MQGTCRFQWAGGWANVDLFGWKTAEIIIGNAIFERIYVTFLVVGGFRCEIFSFYFIILVYMCFR